MEVWREYVGRVGEGAWQSGNYAGRRQSATNLRALRRLGGTRLREFQKAYRYLRSGMRHLLGSGVTEAGCKIVYTQRLKLSGISWKQPGAQTILNLRVLLLSDA